MVLLLTRIITDHFNNKIRNGLVEWKRLFKFEAMWVKAIWVETSEYNIIITKSWRVHMKNANMQVVMNKIAQCLQRLKI